MTILFPKTIHRLILIFLVLLCSTTIIAEMDNHVPMGWAAVPTSVGREPSSGVNVEGTIGGGDGRVVTASGGDLAKYASSKEPLVIMAEGSFSGNIKIAAHKTIIGTGSGSTLRGGFAIGSNVIIRNFKVSGGVDGMQVSGNSSIWIDHCDLSACGDGLLDITNGSDKITVTWVRFSNHHKTMLINKGNKGGTDDTDRNKVTIIHNWFDGSRTRNPRVGYGKVQILNNYYVNNGYAIHTFWNAQVVIERNYFKGVSDAVSDHGGSTPGSWPGPGYVVLIDNYTTNPGSIQKKTTSDPNKIFHIEKYYMYDWVVTKDVQKVPEVVQNGAGTGSEWGKIGAIPTPGQGFAQVGTNPTLKWTKVGSQASNKVYFGTTNPPPEAATVDGYNYKPGQLKEGTVYYWKINDGDIWKFRTKGEIATNSKRPVLSKSNAIKRIAPIQKINVLGKSGNYIGIKNDNNDRLYFLNGKEVLNKKIPKKAVK